MGILKFSYESESEIPEGYSELYSEKDGAWVLSGIDGIKTQSDVDRVQDALRKEKNDHKKTKDRLASFGDRSVEDIEALIEERDELAARLESGEGGKDAGDQAKQLVELRRENAKMARDLEKLNERASAAEAMASEKDGALKSYKIGNAVSKAAADLKIIPEALEDVSLYAERIFTLDDDGRVAVKDEVGFTPGLDPKDWLAEMREKRPHWWGVNQGAGAGGGRGAAGEVDNPFRKSSFNLTRASMLRRDEPQRAKRLYEAAKAAGDLHESAVAPT